MAGSRPRSDAGIRLSADDRRWLRKEIKQAVAEAMGPMMVAFVEAVKELQPPAAGDLEHVGGTTAATPVVDDWVEEGRARRRPPRVGFTA